jgi:UDPglucose--hexose-1-phosphate uridylyltransferase
VLVAPRRSERPHDTGRHALAAGPCPFCEGNERATPREVFADRPTGTAPDGPGWRVRAFPNKYPVTNPLDGIHEVVVTAPRHVTSLADLTREEASRAVTAWAVRLETTALDERGLWPFLFLNQGAPAGASLEHSHAQVVGLPFGPPRLVRRDMAFQTAPSCPLCLDLAGPGERMVAEADGVVAWCPEVPPLSGTVRIAPRRHVPAWTDVLDPDAVGGMIRRVSAAIAQATGVRDLNLWLHQGRPGGGGRFHWHIEMVGRVGTLAGLELGAGVFPVTQDPCDYAERLRAAMPAETDDVAA